jgi:hypothetical protein
MRALRALGWLTLAQTAGLLREGLVRRSLGWPIGLVCGVLLATVGAAALVKGDRSVAVPREADAALAALVAEEGFTVRRAEDPEEAVRRGRAFLGTDGHALWELAPSPEALRLEAALRAAAQAPWTPVVAPESPTVAQTGRSGRAIGRILAVLFALYGGVLGLGGIARDRDDGVLHAELVLPIPRWVPPLARWAAAAGLLTPWFFTAIACLHAILGVSAPAAMAVHGAAGAITAASLGIAAVGDASLRRSFAGPFAAVATVVTGLVTAGDRLGPLGTVLPLASVGSTASPWPAAALALLSGPVAAAVFAWRTRP